MVVAAVIVNGSFKHLFQGACPSTAMALLFDRANLPRHSDKLASSSNVCPTQASRLSCHGGGRVSVTSCRVQSPSTGDAACASRWPRSTYNGGSPTKHPAGVCQLPPELKHKAASICYPQAENSRYKQCGPSVALTSEQLLHKWFPTPRIGNYSQGRIAVTDAEQFWGYIQERYTLSSEVVRITVMSNGKLTVDRKDLSAIVPASAMLYTINFQHPGSAIDCPAYLGMSEKDGAQRACSYLHKAGSFADPHPNRKHLSALDAAVKDINITLRFCSIPSGCPDVRSIEEELLRMFSFPNNTTHNGGTTPAAVHVAGRGMVQLETLPDVHTDLPVAALRNELQEQLEQRSDKWSSLPVKVLHGMLSMMGVSSSGKKKSELMELAELRLGTSTSTAYPMAVAMSGADNQWTPDFINEATLNQLQVYYYQQHSKLANMNVESLRQLVLNHLETCLTHDISDPDTPAANSPASSTATAAPPSRRTPKHVRKTAKNAATAEVAASSSPSTQPSSVNNKPAVATNTANPQASSSHSSSCSNVSDSSSSVSGRRCRRVPEQCRSPIKLADAADTAKTMSMAGRGSRGDASKGIQQVSAVVAVVDAAAAAGVSHRRRRKVRVAQAHGV